MNGHHVYSLTGGDEDIILNFALEELLRGTFAIELPDIEAEDTPCAYFKKLERLLFENARLRLRRFVTIAIFRFHGMALWRDLDPAHWPEDVLLSHDRLALLLGARGGEETAARSFPCDYRIEDAPFDGQMPPLILPADASQHSTLLDASKGRDLAIEGPPGTGKSQTIANLIAAALDRGMRVLFCAEKRAALDVVAKRLKARNFGPLMLELHSDRATKVDVIASLAERDNADPPRFSSKIDRTRKLLKERRDFLRRYLSLLRQPIGELGSPVNALLWRMLKLQEDLARMLPPGFLDLAVDRPERVTPCGLEQSRQALRDVERQAARIEEGYGRSTGCIWHAAAGLPPTSFALEGVREALRKTTERIDELLEFAGETAARLCIPLPQTHELAEKWLGPLAVIPHLDRNTCPDRLRWALASPDELRDHAGLLRAYRAAVENAETIHPTPLQADVAKLRELVEALRRHGIERTSRAQLEATRAAALHRSKVIGNLITRLRPLLYGARLQPETVEIHTIRALLLALRQLDAAGPDIAARISPALLASDANAVRETAAGAAEQLRQRLEKLSTRADAQLWKMYSTAALRAHASILSTGVPLSRLFSWRYRRARNSARAIALDPSLDAAGLASLLQDLATWRTDAESFEARPEFSQLFGAFWKGHATDFDSMRRARLLLEGTDALMRSAGMGEAAMRFATDNAWRREMLAPQVHTDEALQKTLDSLESCSILAEAQASAEANAQECQNLLNLAAAAGVGADGEVTTSEASTDTMFARLHELHNHLSLLPEGSPQRSWHRGAGEDPDRLEVLAAIADAIRTAAPLPAVDKMLRATVDPVAAINDLIDRAERGRALIDAARCGWLAFRNEVDADEGAFLGGAAFERTEWDLISRQLHAAYDDQAGMRLFADLMNKYMVRAESAGVRFVYDAFAERGKPVYRLGDAYELLFIRSLLQQFLGAGGKELTLIGGYTLDEARQEFRDLDEKLYGLEALRIVSLRLHDPVPRGVDWGGPKALTGYALIRHELSKQRHIAVRSLISRAADALQAMKPVWLMSPLSVAQYIAPGTASFDLVVIDEASQMKPEFAVGAIARGAQVVVVGDPKQLPPWDFFENKRSDEEEDEDFEVEEESILDLALNRLEHKRRLKWHYRSRHASLIAFSNRAFYDKELVVFPNPATSNDLLGVKHVYVGGTYANKMNQREADAVIQAAIGLMYAHPEVSIGIVTMNKAQRDLIQAEFDQVIEDDAAVRGYIEKSEKEGIEPFFVKNLENVQGDERDVILISTLYGPAPGRTSVLQRFYPINLAAGHRRLNVLFTRAKMSTRVFTSLRPSDIVVGEKTPEGVRRLREYLEYAAGGASVDDARGGEPDSDFEVFVADRLRAAGYEVVPQVGVEGFRIDLGVRHPSYPIGFIAGIECDGATYHSGLTVRDRDRIRQDVLEGLGWRIYRVWSTDWFGDPDRETERLLEWLSEVKQRAAAEFTQRQAAEVDNPAADEAVTEEPVHAGGDASESPPDMEQDPGSSGDVAVQDEPVDAVAAGSSPPPRPDGRKLTTPDGIEFYETMTGFYEVYVDDRLVGEVERINSGLLPNHINSRTQYRARMSATNEAFNTTDLYVAVREVLRRVAPVAAE